MVERLQEAREDAGPCSLDIPGGVLHEPGGAQEGDRNRRPPQHLLGQLQVVEEIGLGHLRADRGEEDELARPAAAIAVAMARA